MDTFYELLHLPSGNVVGDLDSQYEALAALHRLTDGEPTSPASDFALFLSVGDDQTLVAMQDDLHALAEGLHALPARSR